jgi:hypothetical protein
LLVTCGCRCPSGGHGDVGTGKTHLARALIAAACREGIPARFYATSSLVMQLRRAKDEGRLDRELANIAKNRLLAIDEFGYLPIDTEGTSPVLKIVNDARCRSDCRRVRAHRYSEVFASNTDSGIGYVAGVCSSKSHAARGVARGANIIALDLAGDLPLVPYDSSSLEDLAETVRLVEAEDCRIHFGQGDVRDLAGMSAILERGVAEFGRLDIVVANAGICIPATWDETTPEMFQVTMDTNVTGV